MENKETKPSHPRGGNAANRTSSSKSRPYRGSSNRHSGGRPRSGERRGPNSGPQGNSRRLSATERLRMRQKRKPNNSSTVTHYNPQAVSEQERIGLEKLVHTKEIPISFEGDVKIYFIGGLEQVGQNMVAIQVKDDIVIIDCGLQFPEDNMPGVDYLIPDTDFLEKNKDKIRGMIITHGHMDHIGGIPQVMKKLGTEIPIYGTPLTIGIIKKRQEEFEGALNLVVFNPDDTLYLGSIVAEFFRVNHNIPDCVAIALHTPGGIIVHTGDWKLDHSPINEEAMNFAKATEIGQKGVLALLADSTNAYLPGYQLSEDEIKVNLETIFMKTKGVIYTGCFSTLISRIQQLVLLSEKYGRKVCILGRSMQNNVETALNLGYMKIQPNTLISAAQAKTMDRNKVTIICTGAQGEGNASLLRIAKGNHKELHMQEGDTVTFSSSVVKGNERAVQYLKDVVYKNKVEVFHYQIMDVHAGGHARQEETKLLANLLRPKYFVPIEANYFMLVDHGKVLEQAGFPKERIFIPANGSIMTINQDKAVMEHDQISHKIVAVQGSSVTELTDVIVGDRTTMAENGIFIAIINTKSRKVLNNPDIISRGFIYLRQSKDLIEKARAVIKDEYEKATEATGGNIKETKRMIVDKVERLLFDKVGRSPMVMVVINDVTRKIGDDEVDESEREGTTLTSSNSVENNFSGEDDSSFD